MFPELKKYLGSSLSFRNSHSNYMPKPIQAGPQVAQVASYRLRNYNCCQLKQPKLNIGSYCFKLYGSLLFLFCCFSLFHKVFILLQQLLYDLLDYFYTLFIALFASFIFLPISFHCDLGIFLTTFIISNKLLSSLTSLYYLQQAIKVYYLGAPRV